MGFLIETSVPLWRLSRCSTFNSHHMGFLIETSITYCQECLKWSFNSHHMGFLIETKSRRRGAWTQLFFQFPSYGISHWNFSLCRSRVFCYLFQFPSYGISHWNVWVVVQSFAFSSLSIPIIWDFSLKRFWYNDTGVYVKAFNSHHMGFLIETLISVWSPSSS